MLLELPCAKLFLIFSQVASGESFSSSDYMELTPSWALYGATEEGFDPSDVRVKKERKHGN